MPLMNYTTKIDVKKTLGEIQTLLAEAGAADITIRYNPTTRQPIGVAFSIPTAHGERWFTLPANTDPVLITLRRQKTRNSRVQATEDQAARVAWRIVRDWLEAQLAIIHTGMVAFDQIMLPYMHGDSDGHTIYELAQQWLALPAPTDAAEMHP